MYSCRIFTVLLVILTFQSQVLCDSSSPAGEDTSEAIPLLASGKRQHNIMRFGKRPAGGHSLIHFGKRDEGEEVPAPSSSRPAQHSFLYFGKRDRDVPDLWEYLRKNGEGSYKRGHSIMRFGKRAPAESHNFIRFGRDPDVSDDVVSDVDSDDVDDDISKRNNGHSMMYFGKREGTGTSGHAMMYFGKRGGNNGHSMMYFGKRGPFDGEDYYDDGYSGKRAHAMIHFGKRGEDRGRSHAMIHFGKRGPGEGEEADPVDSLYWMPDPTEAKRNQHNLLRFGKKMDRKGSHAMIHFGKRDVDQDKRAHAMIHFGKRSLQEKDIAANQSTKGPQGRAKREAGQPTEPLIPFVNYEDPEEGLGYDGNPKMATSLTPNDFWSQALEEEWESRYGDFQPDKKDGSKNVFLRFG